MGQGVRDGQWHGRPKGITPDTIKIIVWFLIVMGWTWGSVLAGIGGTKSFMAWLIAYPIIVGIIYSVTKK